MNALLVDDNDLYREVLGILLKDCGYIVELARNAQEALIIFNEKPEMEFDLIVTDYEMPGMLGDALIKSIIARNIPFKKVILLSGAIDSFEFNDKRVTFMNKATPMSELKNFF